MHLFSPNGPDAASHWQGQCIFAPWASLAHGAAQPPLAHAVWGPTLSRRDWRGGEGVREMGWRGQ
eukprot:730096-Prorocentrum_lima.AAC.1